MILLSFSTAESNRTYLAENRGKVINSRKKTEVVYNFHLISVCDTDAVEIDFDSDPPDVKQIEKINYLSRFLVNKEESNHIIQFITKPAFPAALATYDKLHLWYGSKYKSMISHFHERLHESYTYKSLFTDELKQALKFQLKYARTRFDDEPLGYELDDLYVSSNDEKDGFILELVPESEQVIKFINAYEPALDSARKAFKKFYKIDAHVEFGLISDENNIPF